MMVFWRGLGLVDATVGRFEINPLLFADDTALLWLTERCCIDRWGNVACKTG